jgi:hypothetical protein
VFGSGSRSGSLPCSGPPSNRRVGSHRYAVVGGLAAVALLAAACGGGSSGSSAGPRGAVQRGLTALYHGSQLTVTFKSGISPAQLAALGRELGSAPPAEARMLLTDSDITESVRTTNGESLAAASKSHSPSAEQVDFAVTLGGGKLFELRYVNAVFYARLDPGVLRRIDPSATASLGRDMRQFNRVAPALGAFFAGHWLSLSYSQIKSLESQIPGGSSGASSGQGQRLVNSLLGVLKSDATFRNAGTRSGGTVIAITGNVRTIAAGLVHAIASAEPLAASKLNTFKPSQVPSRDVTVDALVTGGVLKQFSINLTQFAPPKDKAKIHDQALPLDVDFSQTAPPVTAPSGAVPLNLGQLFNAFAAGSASSGSGTAGG